MKRHFWAFFLLIIIAAWAGPGSADPSSTDADLKRFLSLWEGDYDNLAQIKAQEASGLAEKDRNQATLLFVRKVNLPAFGSSVFYAEWQLAQDPTKVTRQRIYAFSNDAAERKLRLNLHIWPADNPDFVARTKGAHLDPQKLNGITPADMAQLKGCDVFFDRTINQFEGAMTKGECAFPAPNGKPIYSWSQMKLTSTQFSYLDGWFNLDGSVFQKLSSDWYVFDKKKSN
jgi:hypothetical protein